MARFTLFVIISFIAAYFLRVNLPPNNVNEYLQFNKKTPSTMQFITAKIFTSQTVANWKYKDLLVVKFACSQTMKTEMVALPFNGWGMSYMKDNYDLRESPIFCDFTPHNTL